MWARVQVVDADRVLVRPQLSRQADGGLRYQYNPRVIEAARLIPRGTVFDRRDLPLATDDPEVLRGAAEEYRRFGISLRDACPNPGDRCYPLGGAAFHLLGDARSQSNWAASNTSYVERDSEDRLRGFDDHRAAVRTEEATGRPAVAIRRDYRELVPLVRHRWEPDHPEVRAILSRPRDIHLTIDARLQQQVAAIVLRAAREAGVERAAAVVIDAATGDVLTSVSVPWPVQGSARATSASNALLDRARYGLYPPGSTFKLVTAAAALRQDLAFRDLSLTCVRLPGNRVGARIPGAGPAVRDDVLDRQPHGSIAMRDGLVRSCNAYFAQLAVRLGPDVLTDTAALAGIALSPASSASRVRDNLARSGFGQGDVLATPMRMARVAAAIAADGIIREAPIVRGAGPSLATPFLSPEAARILSGFMREAVTAGTGRLLRDHPGRIAGKTGTSEVEGAASHAWFVGFAPYETGAGHIAFAVIFENAGYGGVRAASVAGEIVTAAGSLGLLR